MDERQAIAARVQARAAGKTVGPWTLEVYPTLRCNLDCSFCDTTERHQPARQELPLSRWLQIIEEAAALGAKRLMVLGGGEPMIAAATLPMMERAKALGLSGMLTTNGTLMSAEAIARIVDMAWDEVHLSIDGAQASTHDTLRGRPGAFRKTVKAACALRQRAAGRAPRLALHTVITRLNYKEIPDIIRLAAALGAWRVDFDALIAYRPEQQALALDPQQMAEVPQWAIEGLMVAKEHGIESTLSHFLQPKTRGQSPPPAGSGTGLAKAPCLKVWHHLVIQADGRSSPCCVLAGQGERIDGSLAKFWEHSSYFNDLRTRMQTGQAGGRCNECSENILVHERAIRGYL
jgi:MoaA/NifB/PqqE/SkfB family radical SAM enzyme